ncbi:uncharacterized protein J3R85_010799 [Psidium guajava]|nr:uncharacterized protein J3R85_010799 [Psidium guajava]
MSDTLLRAILPHARWPLHALGVEPELGFLPSTSAGGALVLIGFVAGVLLDYFWFVSLILAL